MKDSLILGSSTGIAVGAIAGNQVEGDRTENAVKGAVLGGVIFGLASYAIHNSLQKRDAKVRRETLMNLEQYEVLGFEGMSPNTAEKTAGKCFTTKEVDGRVVSIPCELANDAEEVR